MRQIWLTVAAFLLVGGLLGHGAARAEEQAPTVTPEDHVIGKPDAPVTVIEYASLGCPHCAEFDRVTLPEIKKNWIDTGKARLVYRDFPLDAPSLQAAMLARCAPKDRYFAFIDTLFQTQASWHQASDPTAALGNIAKLGGIPEAEFKKCMADTELSDKITAEAFTAQKVYHVDSTPTFFINGQKPPPGKNGAQPYAVFNELLEAALPKTEGMTSK
jgi:protein-disulfide isomerase